MVIVPPGGFVGFAQMTGASRRALFPGSLSRARSPKRRKARSTRGKASRGASRTKRRASGRLPKFGSPAWRKKFGLDKRKRK